MMSVDSSSLTILRQPKQTVILLLTSILGTISGIVDGLMVAIQWWDKRQSKRRREELEAEKADIRNSYSDTSVSLVDKDEVLHDRELIKGLIREDIRFGAANEHLKLIRRIIQDTKLWNSTIACDIHRINLWGARRVGVVEWGWLLLFFFVLLMSLGVRWALFLSARSDRSGRQ